MKPNGQLIPLAITANAKSVSDIEENYCTTATGIIWSISMFRPR
jgi:hypothetical protein